MPQTIFNRRLLRKRRQRASPERGFLFDHVAEDMRERILLVERQFDIALNLGWHGRRALAEPPKVKCWLQSDLAEGLLRGAARPAFAADEEALPLGAERLDLITSILTLHWVNDLAGCLKQIRAALKPDGLFLGVMFIAGTLAELRASLLAAESEVKGGAGAHMIPMADIRDLGHLLQQAGFALPVADLTKLTVRYENIFALLADIRMMGESQALNTKPSMLSRAIIARADEIYKAQFADPDGKIRASFHFGWLCAWAPAAHQPKPLKPGSARIGLAEAVKNISGEKT